MTNNNKNTSRSAKNKKTKAEANARREIAKRWECMRHSNKYMTAAAKVSSNSLTEALKEELFDGIFLNLDGEVAQKSYSCQKRALRRIVEKRQAQSTHHIMGRTRDRRASYTQRHCTSQSIKQLRSYQFCA